MNPQPIISSLFNRRMLVALIMGFSCGLPLLLTLSVLQAWMKEAGVDLATIGLMALVGLPYTLKFIWSPLFDRYTLPFLGRRRGWLLVSQLALMGSLLWLGSSSPVAAPEKLALAALAVTFFSASQDIVVDAYRREDLPDRELGLGSSLYINGYRIGMLLASGGGLILADHMSFSTVYLIMALCLAPGILTTLLTPEPRVKSKPVTLKAAVIEPLIEYFQRPSALWMLAFILMYKIGDTMAAAMTTPFYLDVGFTKSQIGTVVKLFGFWATVGGTIAGGIAMIRLGIVRSLLIFGVLQALSTAGFALLATIGPQLWGLSAVIAFENLSGGMGTAAYAAYMASITDKRFTATQYALLTSLMGVPRVLASAPTGYLATQMGWEGFFIFCTVIAFPGLLLIYRIGGKTQ
jgi:PAT family beta-lactamase induction signal transducer AmpG